MKLCAYAMTTDVGFAPNPFWRYCTLAVCTPNHQRCNLEPRDWILGNGTADRDSLLIYAMRVDVQLTLDDYYHDPRFARKRPGGRTWRQRCGDNIYYQDRQGRYVQDPNAAFHTDPEDQAPDNVGRTLRKGLQPVVKPYSSPARLKADGVEEILLEAGHFPEGRLPLSAVMSVTAFSTADAELVEGHLGRVGARLTVCIDPKKEKYAAGQRVPPGAGFLDLTRRYYEAVWSSDADQQRSLWLELQSRCFD